MHRIDSYNAGPGGTFLDEIPGTRDATALTPSFMQSVQEEIARVIEAADISLAPSGADDTDRDQLLKAIRALNPVKAFCVVEFVAGVPQIVNDSGFNVANVTTHTASNRFRVTFLDAVKTPCIGESHEVYTGGGSSPVGTYRTVQCAHSPGTPTTTFVEFFIFTDANALQNPADSGFNRRFTVTVIAHG